MAGNIKIFSYNSLFSIYLLTISNFMIIFTMFIVYNLGKNSILSDIIIYCPIILIIIVLIRDKFSFYFIFSCFISIIHGLSHKYYPFLDEKVGVNKEIDVWQDQIVHLNQAILLYSIYYNNSNLLLKKMFSIFIGGNILNVILGFFCWGKSCHNIYEWISLLPALASGFHFAIGSLYHTPIETATTGFIIQGMSSISTYFLFRSSDDILKLFAICRFFEIYFIVPHYIGYFYSRYILSKKISEKNSESKINKIFQILGIYNISVFITIPYLTKYFYDI